MLLTNLADGLPLEISDDGVLCIYRAATVTVAYLGGLLVGKHDMGPFLRSIKAAPDFADRHDDLADGQRSEAGRIAMEIEDSMVRARTIDYVDGWGGVCGSLVEKTEEGALHEVSDEDIEARVLVVKCPSTGREYCPLVPQTLKTVAAARLWYNRGVDPELET